MMTRNQLWRIHVRELSRYLGSQLKARFETFKVEVLSTFTSNSTAAVIHILRRQKKSTFHGWSRNTTSVQLTSLRCMLSERRIMVWHSWSRSMRRPCKSWLSFSALWSCSRSSSAIDWTSWHLQHRRISSRSAREWAYLHRKLHGLRSLWAIGKRMQGRNQLTFFWEEYCHLLLYLKIKHVLKILGRRAFARLPHAGCRPGRMPPKLLNGRWHWGPLRLGYFCS